MPGRLDSLVQPSIATGRPDAVAQVMSAAREPWPEIALAAEDFLPFLAQRVADEGVELEALLRLHLADLYLLCAYRRGDPTAAAILRSRFLPRVRAALRRLQVADAEASDLEQMVCKRLLEDQGASYSGRGELVAWMVIAAVRLASTGRRRGRREVELADELVDDDDADDAEIAVLKARYRDAFKLAFAEALASLSPRDRTVLRYYIVDRLNIAQIGSFYGVHRATIARWLAAARAQLLERTREGLMRRAAISLAEIDSVLRLVQTQLDVSLRRALGTADESG